MGSGFCISFGYGTTDALSGARDDGDSPVQLELIENV